MLKKLIHILLNLLFPRHCIGCGMKNEILCRQCINRIDYPTLHEFNNIFAATDYNDEIAKKAIWLLKYRKIRCLAEPLAELMRQRLSPHVKYSVFNIIIPIPLSKKRLEERGFNQSELIAKHFASKSGFENIQIRADILYKIKETPTQVSIKNRQERLNNINDSFAVKNPELIKDKNIILIDDVTTTGATIKEARKILKENGAKKIIALVAARG